MIIIIDLYYLIIDINDYYVSIIYRFITTFFLHYQYLQNTYMSTYMFKLSFFETENMRKSGGKAGEKMKRLNKAEIKLADEKFVVWS